MGEVVAARTVEGLGAGAQRQEIDLEGMAPGAYIVTVATADGLSTSKLTVVR